jgi:hypothetical protein
VSNESDHPDCVDVWGIWLRQRHRRQARSGRKRDRCIHVKPILVRAGVLWIAKQQLQQRGRERERFLQCFRSHRGRGQQCLDDIQRLCCAVFQCKHGVLEFLQRGLVLFGLQRGFIIVELQWSFVIGSIVVVIQRR